MTSHAVALRLLAFAISEHPLLTSGQIGGKKGKITKLAVKLPNVPREHGLLAAVQQARVQQATPATQQRAMLCAEHSGKFLIHFFRNVDLPLRGQFSLIK